MCRSKILVFLSVLVFISVFSFAQSGEFISYTVDGKAFRLTDVKMEAASDGSFLHIEGTRSDKVDFGPNARPRFRDLDTSIVIEISVYQESGVVGTHQGRSSDIMPVYVIWYETEKENKNIEVNPVLASLDSGEEDIMIFSVTIEKFDGIGSLAQGKFSGKLYDEDGNLHEVTEGKFSIICKEMDY